MHEYIPKYNSMAIHYFFLILGTVRGYFIPLQPNSRHPRTVCKHSKYSLEYWYTVMIDMNVLHTSVLWFGGSPNRCLKYNYCVFGLHLFCVWEDEKCRHRRIWTAVSILLLLIQIIGLAKGLSKVLAFHQRDPRVWLWTKLNQLGWSSVLFEPDNNSGVIQENNDFIS